MAVSICSGGRAMTITAGSAGRGISNVRGTVSMFQAVCTEREVLGNLTPLRSRRDIEAS